MKVHAIAGYSEIGRNMTAVEIGNDIIILDMGMWVEKVAQYENGNAFSLPLKKLYQEQIVPDDRAFMKKCKKKVRAIVISHAHLDHSACVPEIAKNYPNVPVIGTPFTIEVIRNILKDRRKNIPNKLIPVSTGKTYKVNDNLTIELIYTTHSTLQTAMVAIHSKEGTVLYANDFKFDPKPLIGKPMDFKRLRQLGNKGVKLLISDTTRIENERKTFSESIAKDMLNEVIRMTESKKDLILVTTFASHLARVKTIVDIAKQMGRTPVIMGRSMLNYISAAERINLIDFKDVTIIPNQSEAKRFSRELNNNKSKFLLITTGTQGEPNAILSKIADGRIPIFFDGGDIVIFASRIIPTPITQANRAKLEKKLKSYNVRIFKDIHVSGHASREDHRDLLKLIKPEHYIPTHGTIEKIASAISLAREEGFVLGKTAHMLQNNQVLEI